MDPAAKIQALEAEREALEKLLLASIDKDREIAIRRNIESIDQQITAWVARLTAPQDERHVWTRAWDQCLADPVQTGAPAMSALLVTWWSACHYLMPLRHEAAPYTDVQFARRKFFFALNSSYPAGAKKVAMVSAAILVVKGLIKGSIPKNQ